MKITAALVAFTMTSGAAMAQMTHTIEGVATGTTNNTVHALSENHVVLQVNSLYDPMMLEGGDDAMNGMGGTCFGSIEINAGEASGGGNCVFRNEAGDMLANHWHVEGFGADGAIVGTYQNTGGTGKYAGATGGGTFSSLTDQETSMFQNSLSGDITMP